MKRNGSGNKRRRHAESATSIVRRSRRSERTGSACGKPVKRRGNRRYYQHHEVLLIRRIRELLYEQGFTINGARNRLDSHGRPNGSSGDIEDMQESGAVPQVNVAVDVDQLRKDILQVIDLLGG